jgi:predicted amidohydrolase YtcJ
MGKLADVVVLDRDIFKINPSELDTVKVAMTIADGKVVWEVK